MARSIARSPLVIATVVLDLATIAGVYCAWDDGPSKPFGRLLFFLVAWALLAIACARGYRTALGMRRTVGVLGPLGVGAGYAVGMLNPLPSAYGIWSFGVIAVFLFGAVAIQRAFTLEARERRRATDARVAEIRHEARPAGTAPLGTRDDAAR